MCFQELTGQGQRSRHFRAKKYALGGRESKMEQRTGVNRPERALGADTVPQRKRKGNREDVNSGQEWCVTAWRTKYGKNDKR